MAPLRPPRVPKGTVARAIYRVLRSDPNRLWRADQIAARTRHTAATIRTELTRIVQKEYQAHAPPVVRVDRGLYRVWWDHAEIDMRESPPPKLHAISLRTQVPQNRRWVASSATPQPTLDGHPARSEWEWSAANGRWLSTHGWRGRAVKVWVAPRTGTVAAYCEASRPEDNMDPSEFHEFCVHLETWCQVKGLLWLTGNVVVDSFEFNRDYCSLTLSGLSGERLRRFRNVWAQVYQKQRDLVRMEVRVQGDGRLTAAEVHGILERFMAPPAAQVAPEPDPLGPEVA